MRDGLSIILATAYRRTDALRRVALARAFLAQRFFGGGAPQPVLDGLRTFLAAQSPEDSQAMCAWGAAFYESLHQEDADMHLQALESAIRSLPYVVLYVPTTLDERSIDAIGQWLRSEVDPQALFDLSIDAALGAGCAVRWGDAYHDYSLAPRLREKHREIAAMIEATYA